MANSLWRLWRKIIENKNKILFLLLQLLVVSLFVNFHFSLVLSTNIPLTLTHFMIIIVVVFVFFLKDRKLAYWIRTHIVETVSISFFILWSFVAIFWAQYKGDLIECALKWTLTLVLIPVISILLENESKRDWILKSLFFGAGVLGYISLVEYILLDKSQFIFKWFKVDFSYPRVSATFNTPNPYGAFMSVVSIIGLILFISKKISFKQFIFFETGSVLGLALSGSRNSMIAYLLGLTVVLFYFRKYAIGPFLISLLIFLTVAMGFSVSMQRLEIPPLAVFPWFDKGYTAVSNLLSVQTPIEYKLETVDIIQDPSFNTRIELYRAAISCFIKNPIGIGSGNFLYRHTEFLRGLRTEGIGNYHAHNIFLNTLVEQGILGFLSLCMFIFSIIKKGWGSYLQIPFFLIIAVQFFDFFINNNAQIIFLFSLAAALSLTVEHRRSGCVRKNVSVMND